MRKLWIMSLILVLLCAACGKQTETPEEILPSQSEQTVQTDRQDEQPSQNTPPSAELPPDVQQTDPEEPETPVLAGPADSFPLYAVDAETESYLWDRAAFLDGRTAARIVPAGAGQQLQILDLVDGTVHGSFALPGSYDPAGRYVRLAYISDNYHLNCSTGEEIWSVTVDQNWQMEGWLVQPSDPELATEWQMGKHTVTKNEEGSILVDGVVVLRGNQTRERPDACPAGEGYGVRAVLDSHRLLVVRGNGLIATAYGIYDYRTDELTLLAEGEPSLYPVGEHHALLYHGSVRDLYGFQRVELSTGTCVPLDTGFTDPLNCASDIRFSRDSTRFLLNDWENRQVKVFDLFSGECVFTWNYPGEGMLWPQFAGDGSLLLFLDGRGWSVELTEAAAEPAPPTLLEPDGAVAMVQLPEAIPGLQSVADIVPLEDGILAFHGYADGAVYLLIYDMDSSTVLSRLEVEGYDGTNVLELLERDPYVLFHYDGQAYWRVTVGETWQMTREETSALELYYSMNGMEVEDRDGNIILGGDTVLSANDRVVYFFTGVLDDHRLLYYAQDSIYGQSHYGVYDHATGETRAVTMMGQHVVGSWDGMLLIARYGSEGYYDFGTVTLTDYTYTPLEMGHETAETAVNTDYDPAYIQCNTEASRLMLIWDEDGTRTVQVVDLETGGELYRLESPAEEGYQFYLTDNNRLVVQKGLHVDSTLWLVAY